MEALAQQLEVNITVLVYKSILEEIVRPKSTIATKICVKMRHHVKLTAAAAATVAHVNALVSTVPGQTCVILQDALMEASVLRLKMDTSVTAHLLISEKDVRMILAIPVHVIMVENAP